MPLISVDRFKSMVSKAEAIEPDLLLHKLLTNVAEQVDDRCLRFTISNGSVDRQGDVVEVDGWDLKAYMSNPVVLWGHDATSLPIGKCTKIGIEDNALKAVVEFVSADMPVIGPQAEAVLRMCRDGFLSATSVGFRPIEYRVATERMGDDDWWPVLDYQKQELCEWSVVGIPANAEALIEPNQRRSLESQRDNDLAVASAHLANATRHRRLLIAHAGR